MDDMKASRITIGLHTVIAVAIGYASNILQNSLLSIGLGIVVMFVLGFLSELVTKTKKGTKFWIANGVFIYLLVWLITWTYFLNMVSV